METTKKNETKNEKQPARRRRSRPRRRDQPARSPCTTDFCRGPLSRAVAESIVKISKEQSVDLNLAWIIFKAHAEALRINASMVSEAKKQAAA